MISPISLLQRGLDEANGLVACYRAGLIGLDRPDRLLVGLSGVSRYGAVGGAVAMAAARYGDRVALVDERGSLTYRELNERSNALANGWRANGLRPGDGVAILARNHRGFIDATFAAAKCGARIVLLNTDFAGPQIAEVVAREGVDLLVHDTEYAEMVDDVEVPFGRWRAWTDVPGEDTIDALIASHDPSPPPNPGVAPKIIILTSGTTGTPKGATRSEPRGMALLGALLGKLPYRNGDVMACWAPMFHALGFAQAIVAVGFGDTLVLRRRFDPQPMLEDLETHRVTTVVGVPIMLQRVVDLGEESRRERDLSALRIIFVAGAQLGATLCTDLLDAFGPVVYNLYGSTEVAYATIATPDELAAAPDSVGSPVHGVVVKILDDEGKELPTGQTGRIFVANGVQFEGYTGGGGKEIIDGLMSSGDVGHFNEAGLLFIDGRDDEMIVSGGENVFPGEVEQLLLGHPEIADAAAIGVDDATYGKRLQAFVVLREGAALRDQDVKEYVRSNLARFKVPRDVVFLDELPRNPTGKILKRQLAAS
jgi:fatty-acyl-CoA synthase